MLVLVLVAVIVVAALGTVAFLLLSAPAPPSGPRLDHVTVSSPGGTTPYQETTLTLSAVAVDSSSVVQTANATFAWAASPASAVQIGTGATAASVLVTAVRGGSVTVYANATWKGDTKSGSLALTIVPLSFSLTSSNYHPLVPVVPSVSAVILTLRVVTPANTTYTSYQGTVAFTSTDPAATLPANSVFSLADAGVKTYSGVTITMPGAVTITATDTAFPVSGSAILYGNRAPVADFTITPNPSDPRQITVDGSRSSDPDAAQTLSYSWAFGDLTTGVGVTATHTYATAGTYIVALTATDNWGASNVSSQSYTAHSPPTAAFSIKSQAANGANVLLWANASASTGGDGKIVYYNWTWGDGNYSQVSSPLAAHNYTSFWNGKTVTITLRVANNYSLTNVMSRDVLVTSVKTPPVATFTYSYSVGPIINRVAYRTLSTNATGSYSPTGVALLYYNWTWGDGSGYTNVTVPTTSHVYTGDGSYVVNLTVVDANGLKGYHQVTVTISVPASPPTALFSINRVKLSVTVDGNASWDPNNNIAFYNWTWGDSPSSFTNTTNPWAAHTYAAAGYYTVTLTVWDTTNLRGTAVRYATVALSTLDYRFSDFFNVPYGEWWDFRTAAYGDLPVNSNCFNATSVADGVCKVANPGLPTATPFPYTDWYPAPFGSLFYHQPGNDPFIYAPYRFSVVGASVPGYNLSEPVFLPVMNYGQTPGNLLQFSWNMQYLTQASFSALAGAGCIPKGFKMDGFMLRSQIYLTLDPQEARRLFNLPSSDTTRTSIQNWFAGGINNSCTTQGTLEANFQNALANEGNGKYDIWNSFQYPYTPFYTNFSNVVVDPNLTIHVAIDMSGWGTEVLLARMFYWGNASYAANYLNSTKAKGWWGMELAWLEDFHFGGNLDPSAMNFTLRTVMEYHFQAGSAKGPDGTYRSATNGDTDDVPFWTWGPWLSDYVASSNPHPTSELTRWNGRGYFHSTPGGINYGQNGSYDYAPLAWPAKFGETWHFVFPVVMRFYDPIRSPIPSNPQGDLQYWTGAPSGVPYVLWKTNPANFGTYDNASWIWDVYGKVAAGTWPPGWPQNRPGSYPIEPWGSIFFVPQGSRPQIGTAAFVSAAAPAMRSGDVGTGHGPGIGMIVSTSTLPPWTSPPLAAPARIRWTLSRSSL